MKIYISGTFNAQHRLRARAEQLWKMGHEITSSWLHETAKPAVLTEGQWNARLATKDIVEVAMADCLILDLDEDSTTGGRYVEWGVASHPRDPKLRFTVGGGKRPRGCFNYLADSHFETWEKLLAFFKSNYATSEM